MKHAFLLTGSNAAGKTTTVQKALEPFCCGCHDAALLGATAYCDDCMDKPRTECQFCGSPEQLLRQGIMNIRADNDGRFKGDAQAQRRALTEVWLSDVPILMIEGTRINTPLMDVYKKNKEHRELTVIMALQKPDIMKKHLMDRCAKKNKIFEAGYWDYKKLEYEGMKRYPNSFRKNGIQATRFMIDAEYKVCQEIVDLLQTRFREILG